jgi:hypothetical protein
MKLQAVFIAVFLGLISCSQTDIENNQKPDEQSEFNATMFGHNIFYINEYENATILILDSIKQLNNPNLNELVNQIESKTSESIDFVQDYENILLKESGNANVSIDDLKNKYDLLELKNMQNSHITSDLFIGKYYGNNEWCISHLGDRMQTNYSELNNLINDYNIILPIAFSIYNSNNLYDNEHINETWPFGAFLVDGTKTYQMLGELKGIELEIVTVKYITLKTIYRTEQNKLLTKK